MIKYISDAFKIMIKKSDWMDNTSKQLALDKVNLSFIYFLFNIPISMYIDKMFRLIT